MKLYPRGLPLETKHMVDGNDVIRPCIIFFGGAKLVSMNTQSKNLDFAWIRNAFFVERKYKLKRKTPDPKGAGATGGTSHAKEPPLD